MTPEQYQRSYLLPPGCKDLIDVLRLEELHRPAAIEPDIIMGQSAFQGAETFSQVWKLKPQPPSTDAGGSGVSDAVPAAFFLEVHLPESISINFLATLLGRKPFQVVANLMEFGVFATPTQKVDFETAAKLLRKYGLLARRS